MFISLFRVPKTLTSSWAPIAMIFHVSLGAIKELDAVQVAPFNMLYEIICCRENSKAFKASQGVVWWIQSIARTMTMTSLNDSSFENAKYLIHKFSAKDKNFRES